MITVNVRAHEGCAPQPSPLWDAVWNPLSGTADWAYAGAVETSNRGGLAAQAVLDTAVIICLFTDRQCPVNHPLAGLVSAGDSRGWWGDGVDVRADLFEQPLGSLLWLLERATATPRNAQWAQSFALDALQILVTQGAAARVDAQCVVTPPSRFDLAVQLYGRDGAKIYDRRFDDIWRAAFVTPNYAPPAGVPSPAQV